jgi:aspartokinase
MPPVLHEGCTVRFATREGPSLPRVDEEEALEDPELPAFDTGPGPPRAAFLIAYAAVVLAGLFGGAIGYGLQHVSRSGSSATGEAIGALVGAAFAAIGTGVVAVLSLRAMAEWRRPPGAGANDRTRPSR